MSILLTVLKIIGIILLVILGIICLVLFVPLRYRGNGSYNSDGLNISVRVSWLLHIISVRIGYEGKDAPHIKARVFGITLYDNLKVNKKEKKSKTKNKKKEQAEEKEENDDIYDIQAASFEEPVPDVSESYNEENSDETFGDFDVNESSSDTAEPQKEKFTQKLTKIVKKLVDFVRNIKYTFQKICDTIADIRANVNYYLNVLKQDSTKAAFNSCKTQLLRVFKRIAPKKFRVNLHLGFDDPYILGEIMSVWGMLYPFHEGRINIDPDFDHKIIEADFFIKGHISLFVFIRAALIILFDKNIRKLYRQITKKS